MNTEENELLIELNKVDELIKKVKVTRDVIVKAFEIQQLQVIYNKLKEVYPSVRFTNPNGGCGSCVWDFLQQIIPVFDRLTSSAKPIEVEEDVKVGSVEYNRQNVNEVVEPPKKKTGGRKNK